MRLLRTTTTSREGEGTLELVEFASQQVPPYAILSHCWNGNNEVLFADVQSMAPKRKPAFAKVMNACIFARHDGFDYIWIDTCCIDKTSSAELSEAINSMWKYYASARKCYAYLADVSSVVDEFPRELSRSRWFSRGWTLQELLAPTSVEFLSKDWEVLGDKRTLCPLLVQITGICASMIITPNLIDTASVAMRMSWAAFRRTTRKEDVAYCLMGIFDVNMPLLYGEGDTKAFQRLQEEIMKKSDDHTILAWGDDAIRPDDEVFGPLAQRPSDFARSGTLLPYEFEDRSPFSTTNRGLNIELHLSKTRQNNVYVAALACSATGGDDGYSGILVRKATRGTNLYYRTSTRLLSIPERGSLRRVSLLKWNQMPAVRETDYDTIYPYNYFQLRNLRPSGGFHLIDVVHVSRAACGKPPEPAELSKSWVPSNLPSVFRIPKTAWTVAVALLLRQTPSHPGVAIILGSREQYEVGVAVVQKEGLGSIDELEKAFSTSTPGKHFDIGSAAGFVEIKRRVEHDKKIYMVDVAIWPDLLSAQQELIRGGYVQDM